MKTPMILPWLARRHGIPESRAEVLWADALRHATETTGWVGTSDYWKAAMDRLIESLQAESPYRPHIAQAVRTAYRFGLIPYIVWQGAAKLTAKGRSRINRTVQPA